MELIIRNNSGQPIYDQISGQIKAQILSGALSPGDALPSIRGLAKDLKISVITTKRAYDELEAQGLINTVVGKGCFVAEPDLALFREQSLHLLEDHLAAAAELARTSPPRSFWTPRRTSAWCWTRGAFLRPSPPRRWAA